MRTRRPTTLLGIGFRGEHLTLALAHRTGGRVEIRASRRVHLATDPLNDDPEVVGLEIRKHLDDAGIRVRRCVVCVPLRWVFTARIDVPDLPEADIDGYLGLQAEKEFPIPPEHLALAVSRYREPGGPQRAMLMAIPRDRVAVLQRILKEAGLHPVGITLGIVALMESLSRDETAMSLSLNGDSVELAIAAGGAVALLRSLDSVSDDDEAASAASAARLLRDLRITLGQLPREFLDALDTVRLFGPPDRVEATARQLAPVLERFGLRVSAASSPGGAEAGSGDGTSGLDGVSHGCAAAAAAAAHRLSGRPSRVEFLPPRRSRLKQWTGQVSSRAALWSGAAALAVAVVVFGAFQIQAWRLSRLEDQWRGLSGQVARLKIIEDKVRQSEPWFQESVPSLALLRDLTRAFPEEGSVVARSLTIRFPSEVVCSGVAGSRRDWMEILDRLAATPGIDHVQIVQVRGDQPVQFTMNLRWNGGGTDGS